MQMYKLRHCGADIMGAKASQITSLTIVYSTIYSGVDKKHESSALLAFVWRIHRWLANSPHKWPVTRKMFPFDDVIMGCYTHSNTDPLASQRIWPLSSEASFTNFD